MDSHKLTLIDSSTGKHKDIKVADDYVSVTVNIQQFIVEAYVLKEPSTKTQK